MKVGCSIIESVLPTTGAWHLLEVLRDHDVESFLYVPVSESPGFSTDTLRIDRLPVSGSAAAVLTGWLSRYESAAGGSILRRRVIEQADDEFTVVAGYGHSLVGAHATCLRFLHTPQHDYAIQFVGKVRALQPDEVQARLEFLRACNLEDDVAGSETFSSFARAAHERSESLTQLLQRIASRQTQQVPFEELRLALAAASPFRVPLVWATLARVLGQLALDEPRIDDFEECILALRLAALTLYDEPEKPQSREMLYATAASMAEMLMLSHGELRVRHLAEAAAIYDELAAYRHARGDTTAIDAEAFAVLCASLGDDPIEGARMPELSREATQTVAESFFHYLHRLAFIAKRKGRELHWDVCLVADLIQLIMERGAAAGMSWDDTMGSIVSATDYQIRSQCEYYGTTHERLERSSSRAAEELDTRGTLLYLRPLYTSRRGRLANDLPAEELRELIELGIREIPSFLSFEAALNFALKQNFQTFALGGATDLLGMARQTAPYRGSSSELDWQFTAKIHIEHAAAILMLLDDTDGLTWEIGEIARQNLLGKLCLFVAPRGDTDTVTLSAACTNALVQAGIHIPPTMPPGFVLLDNSGHMIEQLPLSALWNGHLASRLASH